MRKHGCGGQREARLPLASVRAEAVVPGPLKIEQGNLMLTSMDRNSTGNKLTRQKTARPKTPTTGTRPAIPSRMNLRRSLCDVLSFVISIRDARQEGGGESYAKKMFFLWPKLRNLYAFWISH